MRFLVLGASGQLGREFCDYLQQKHMDFKAYSSSALDITDAVKLDEEIAYQRPSVIINCAAFTQVDKAEDDQFTAFKINHIAVRNLARACKKYNTKLIHFSTDYVYPGMEDDRFHHAKGYKEDHRKDPLNAYGESKLLGENEILASGCDHIILRVSWLCGKYGKNFVKTMIDLGIKGTDLRVVNDQWGSPTFTSDLVRNTIRMIQEGVNGIFNYTSDGLITWYDLAREALSMASVETKIEGVPSEEYVTRAIRPKFSKLNTDKIKSLNEIRIPDWKDGLRQLIDELAI